MTKEQAIKQISELFTLAGYKTKEFKNCFGLMVKSEHFPMPIEEVKGESLCCQGDNGINFHCQCDSDDDEALDQINCYDRVIQNIINKIKPTKEIKMTRAERIAKAKAILAEIERDRVAFDMQQEKAREEYLEEQQARLDAEAEDNEVEADTPDTSIKKLFKGLAEYSPDYETWSEDIANDVCSENIQSIIVDERMTKNKLKSLMNSLEVPYKMWRRIDAYLKRHSESE